jgi:hypothetical protein
VTAAAAPPVTSEARKKVRRVRDDPPGSPAGGRDVGFGDLDMAPFLSYRLPAGRGGPFSERAGSPLLAGTGATLAPTRSWPAAIGILPGARGRSAARGDPGSRRRTRGRRRVRRRPARRRRRARSAGARGASAPGRRAGPWTSPSRPPLPGLRPSGTRDSSAAPGGVQSIGAGHDGTASPPSPARGLLGAALRRRVIPTDGERF